MTLASDQKLDLSKLSPTSRRLLELRETVLKEWEERTRLALEKAKEIRHPVFINTMPAYYDNLVEALTPDYPRSTAVSSTTLASEHGGERARMTDYDPEALILEYQIFRQAIFDVLHEHTVELTSKEVLVINTSIDEAIREATTAFSLVVASMRERFIAALAHDMRSPLSAAAMAVELISLTTDSPKTKQLAVRAVENLSRVEGMIEGLLDTMVFQNGERLRLHISHFDILDVVKEVESQTLAVHSVHCQVLGQSVLGWWGREAIRRAIENLIGNAIKYGNSESPIRIKCDAVHERLQLSIHNEGPAIPVEEQESIFQIFRRAADAKAGKAEGWGIGLPYVRAVAESHGGSIGVDSHAERGTTFVIDIPLDSRPYQSAPTMTTE